METASVPRSRRSGMDAHGERTEAVIRDLRLFDELGRWVGGEHTSPPDLSSLHPSLTAKALEEHKAELSLWKEMFSESLANYRELLDMSPAEWAALKASDLSELRAMVRQATSGIVIWM